MLEPWIIEEIQRREEEERRRQERPYVELPVAEEMWPPRTEAEEDVDEPKRGVVIIGM